MNCPLIPNFAKYLLQQIWICNKSHVPAIPSGRRLKNRAVTINLKKLLGQLTFCDRNRILNDTPYIAIKWSRSTSITPEEDRNPLNCNRP